MSCGWQGFPHSDGLQTTYFWVMLSKIQFKSNSEKRHKYKLWVCYEIIFFKEVSYEKQGRTEELSHHRLPRKHYDETVQCGIVPTSLEPKRDIAGKSGHIQIKPEV